MKKLISLLPLLLPMLIKAQCTASFTVSANPSTVVCPGSSVTYSASGVLLASFTWSNGSTNSSITVNAEPNTEYVVNVTDSNGCTASDTLIPSLSNLKTTITFTSTPCSPSITILSANGTGGASPYTYTWYNASGDYSTDTIPTPIPPPSGAGSITLPSYSVTITDLNGCTSSAQVYILPMTPFSSSLPATYSVCANQGGGLAVQNGLTPIISGGTPQFQYLWNTGTTTSYLPFKGLSSGIYSITITDKNGCTTTTSDTLTVFPTPKITLTAAKNPMQIGWIDTLIVSNGLSYLWSNDSTEASIIVRPRISTDYWVTGWDSNGCSNSAYTTIVVSRDYWMPSPDTTIPHNQGFPPIYNAGNVSIGGDSTYSPHNALDVHGNVVIDSVLTVKDTFSIINPTTNSKVFSIDKRGNTFNAGTLSIGTTYVPGGYAFSVNGAMIATDSYIELFPNWPDYVFDKKYKLRSLEDLEDYLNINKHLPGLPSAQELKEKGSLSIGETVAQNTKEIEELTLYLIELNKKVKALEEENKKLLEEIKKK